MENRPSTCVKCGAEKIDGPECPQCGVIYARAEAALKKKAEEGINKKIDKIPEKEDAPIQKESTLTTCPACKREISKRATSCPHCGDPINGKHEEPSKKQQTSLVSENRNKAGVGCLSLIFILGFLSFLGGLGNKEKTSVQKEPSVPQESIDPRRKTIEKCFSGWDGSHMKLELIVKKSMNDPKSYEHDETKFFDMKDHLVVITSFRGRNGFGGMVRNFVKAKTDINTCEVVEIIEQGNY